MEAHRLDVVSLLAGLVCVAVAVLGLTDTLTLRVDDLRWLAPSLLVAFGLALLLTAGGGRRDGDRWADAGTDDVDEGDRPAAGSTVTDGR